MATTGVARRYARAILDIAKDENNIDGWARDLDVVRSILGEPTMSAFLANPAVPTTEKMRMLADSLPGIGLKVRHFVDVLIENGRIQEIDNVVDTFKSEVDRLRGIVHAHVTTAVELDDPELAEVTRGLEKLTGRHVLVSTAVDPTLLGGFVARIGDQLIDASVVGRLNALRASLIS